MVLGLPKNMDGTEGPRAEKSRAFAELLRERTGLEVRLWDERRSSVEAHAILSANGYDVIVASSGSEAFSMISSHCPDLVVLDLGLPDMDGWRATSAPHTYEKQDPPVFVTGRRTLLFSGLGYGG